MRIAIIVFAFLITSILVGQRLGFVWAGGHGDAPGVAVIERLEGDADIDRAGSIRAGHSDAPLRRGEIIRTGDGARALVQVNEIQIAMDERTDIELVDLSPQNTTIKLTRGRILAENPDVKAHPFAVETNQLVARLGSVASVVNYDFRETVSFIPIEGPIGVAMTKRDAFITQTPVDVKETDDPPAAVDVDFDPFSSAASAFYNWAQEQLLLDTAQ